MKVIVFNDGSLAAKLLEKECKDNKEITVGASIQGDATNIAAALKSIDKDTVVYLPFTLESFSKNKIDEQRPAIATQYPDKVFYAYEYMSEDAVKQRAFSSGLISKEELDNKEKEKPAVQPENNKNK